eukprot:2916563-Prymnesium_polylepis.1
MGAPSGASVASSASHEIMRQRPEGPASSNQSSTKALPSVCFWSSSIAAAARSGRAAHSPCREASSAERASSC